MSVSNEILTMMQIEQERIGRDARIRHDIRQRLAGNGKFLWADGALVTAPGFGKIHHRDLLQQMREQGLIEGLPQNYVGGDYSTDEFHGPQFDRVKVIWSEGDTPDEDDLRSLIQQQLGRTAATSEDTEPQGDQVGFLADPKSALYPPLFGDGQTVLPEANKKIKNHVLNAIEYTFKNPDQFIYFTIYGSGISYNWDEGGDLDLQMWVDFDKFQQSDQGDWTADDLLAEVRRLLGPVNFPTFKSIGLNPPANPKVECDGTMMIQYYAKLGKGSREENLTSQPYACYDMETNKWLVRPKPMKPSFYGDHFLALMPKAEDMATQAEQMLDEYERNLLNWQFWFSLYSRYKKAEYREQYQQAQRNVLLEQAGIKTMFEAVFGGRAEAYSPGGHGIKDERDIMQKLLEVWGIFQRLKHYARAPLPWDEQNLPETPSENAGQADPDKKKGKTGDYAEDFGIVHDLSVPAYVRWRNAQIDRVQSDPLVLHSGWRIAKSLLDRIIAQGGGTFTNDGKPVDFHDGFFVSVEGRELTLDVNEVTEDTIIRYAHDWLKPGELLGAWINEGRLYLDSTRHIDSLPDAISFGEHEHQRAIWDITGNREIFLNDDPTLTSKLAEAKYPPSANPSPEHDDPGGWAGIMDKAQRLRNEGGVQVLRNGVQNIVGQVQGDNGVYDTEIWRQDPGRNTISLWNCSCPWGGVSWGRTRQWKKYEGRPCAHTLALYWEAQTRPLDEEYDQNQQLQIPGIDPFINQQIPNVDLNQAVQQTVQPTPTTQPAPTMPTPVMPQSQPIAPEQQDEQTTIQFPGALSKWHRQGAVLNNGDYARINKAMIGYDDRGTQYTVPRNSIVEIIWSDAEETIAIYSLDSGLLGPHNARITGPTNLFSWVPRTRGTAPRRQR